MFGFGRSKKVKEPKPEPEPIKPVRFYAYGNSVCQMGLPPWPPMIRDNAGRDRSEIYEFIAEAMNIKHRYSFVRKQLELTVAAYERRDIDKQKVADDLIHMLQVIKSDEAADKPLLEKHERIIADWERRNGNWGG